MQPKRIESDTNIYRVTRQGDSYEVYNETRDRLIPPTTKTWRRAVRFAKGEATKDLMRRFSDLSETTKK